MKTLNYKEILEDLERILDSVNEETAVKTIYKIQNEIQKFIDVRTLFKVETEVVKNDMINVLGFLTDSVNEEGFLIAQIHFFSKFVYWEQDYYQNEEEVIKVIKDLTSSLL